MRNVHGRTYPTKHINVPGWLTHLEWNTPKQLSTRDKGIIYSPDSSRGLEVYVDADFTGAFDHLDSNNVDTARSRHGYIITYAGMPIIWKA